MLPDGYYKTMQLESVHEPPEAVNILEVDTVWEYDPLL